MAPGLRRPLAWALIAPLAVVVLAGQEPAGARATALGEVGWQAIKASRLEAATEAFEAAIALNPRDARLLLGAGLAAHLAGHPDRARGLLSRALDVDPRLTAAALLLGELAYRAGEEATAIRIYEDALRLAPENAQLKARLESWRRETELHAEFQQHVGNRFTVLFEGPAEERLATRALEVLDAAYWRIGTTLGAYPNEIITVVLYTQEQFRDVTRSPGWAAGAFDGKIRVPVRGALDKPSELQRVLTHELAHAIVRHLAPRGVPTWLDEGLAVLFEGDGLESAERRVRTAPLLIPLTRLERGFGRLEGDQARLAYAESALAADVLVERAGASLTPLLQDLSQGVPFSAALAQRVYLSEDEFQALWQQRLQRPTP